MKSFRSLNTRLVLSHLVVSLVSIVLMAVFAGRSLFEAAEAEAQHNLQSLAFATGNALELPIQELEEGKIELRSILELLNRMFSDSADTVFTLYWPDGTPFLDSSNELPPNANPANAPEVLQALGSDLSTGVDIRDDQDGVNRLFVAVLVQREIQVTAILRLGIPTQPTTDSARRSMVVLLLAAFAIASGISLFGWILASNLSRPIQALTQAATKMGSGDLSARVKPSGPEEMHHLAEAFNSMAGRLQSNVNELRAFVANASHELRTPLTSVKLRVEALREGALSDTEVAERFLGDIENEVDRLVRMVNDLLDLSRMEAGLDSRKRVPINLSTIAHEVFETFNIRASRSKVTVHLDIEPGLPPINGNEDQLRRVFYNLMDNAVKYTPENGQVEILLRPGPREKTVRLLVRDTGPGISPEHLPHVFERFYRAETTQSRAGIGRGSGLGLAIAKSIIDNHGGEMGVSSQVGSGTTFWADLPASI